MQLNHSDRIKDVTSANCTVLAVTHDDVVCSLFKYMGGCYFLILPNVC